MNSRIPEWVIIRDIKNDIMYEGWVQAFSDATEPDEIFLRNVKIYKNSTSKLMYETKGLYLSQKKENLLIEFPFINSKEYSDEQKNKEEK